MAILDQYGRPIQPGGTPGSTGFGVRDLAGGEFFSRLLGRGQEVADKTSSAAQEAVRKAGGLKTIGSKTLNLAGRYAPLVGGGLQLLQGDPLGAVGSVAGGVLAAPFGPLASIAGATVGGPVLKAIASPIAQAAQGLMGSAQQREMARGESPGILGIPGLSAKDIGGLDSGVIERIARATGKTQVEVAEALYPLQQRGRDADLQRQMQINQQTGQITGALNRQLYMAQLAGGAQAQAGETVRTMLTAPNPYAASAFQYRGG